MRLREVPALGKAALRKFRQDKREGTAREGMQVTIRELEADELPIQPASHTNQGNRRAETIGGVLK